MLSYHTGGLCKNTNECDCPALWKYKVLLNAQNNNIVPSRLKHAVQCTPRKGSEVCLMDSQG